MVATRSVEVGRRVCRNMTQLRPTCDDLEFSIDRVAKMSALWRRRDIQEKDTYCVASASKLAFVNSDLLDIWLGLGRGLRFD